MALLHHLQRRDASRVRSEVRIVFIVAILLATGRYWAKAFAQTYQSTVRGSNDAPREDSAADSSVITDDRTPRVGETVPQLLSELPGVTINRTGGLGSAALVSLRGSSWSQVGVYIDGIPLNSANGGGVDISTLPLGDVERIEVYRGSSPIGFGGSAIGGIISITTRAPRADRIDGEASVGSFGTYSAGLSGAWVSRYVRVYVGAHYLTSTNDYWFTQDNGTAFDTSHDHEERRQNAAVRQADGTVRAVVSISPDRTLTAEGMVFYRDQGLPGFGSIRQTTETSLSTLRFIGSTTYESHRDLGADSLVRAQLYVLREQEMYRDPLGEISLAPQQTNDLTTTLGLRVTLARPFTHWLRGTIVLEGRNELFRPFDLDASPARGDPGSRVFGSAGFELDAFVKRIGMHVLPSVRVEVDRDERSGRNANLDLLEEGSPITHVMPIARLAILEQLAHGVTLRANGGRYTRVPSLLELYGDSGFVLGNPTLSPESGWNADVGVDWHFDRGLLNGKLSATGFSTYADDLIEFEQDSYGRARAINIGRARILGVEGALDLRVGRWGRLVADLTYNDARDVSDTSVGRHEDQLPNRPRVHFYARPEGRWPVRSYLTLGVYVDFDVMAGDYIDPANLVEIPTRFLVGGGLFAELPRNNLTIIASAQNLGDARTFDFAGFPLPSRAFYVSARFGLTRKDSP